MITGNLNSVLLGIYALDSIYAKAYIPKTFCTLSTKTEKVHVNFLGDFEHHYWWLDQLCYRNNTNSLPPIIGRGAFTAFGENVNIILFDSGINADHEDLVTKVFSLPNFTSSQGSNLSDVYGTGTHSAGLICSEKVGVATKSIIYSARVLDNQGVLNETDFENAVTATLDLYNSNLEKYIVLLNFFSIPTKENSFIPKQYNENADNIYKQVKRLLVANVPVITPAGDGLLSEEGNLGRVLAEIVSPAYIKEVFTVGAITDIGIIADYSSYGKRVDIFAPGMSSIISCSNTENNKYKNSKSVTKPAAALVTGVAALYLEKMFSSRPTSLQLFSRLKSESNLSILSNRVHCILTDPIFNTNNPFFSIRINEIDNINKKTLFPYIYEPVDKDFVLYAYFIGSNLQFISDYDLGFCDIGLLLNKKIEASSITFANDTRALQFTKINGPEFLNIDSKTGFLIGKIPENTPNNEIFNFVIEISDGITKKQKEFTFTAKSIITTLVTGYVLQNIGKKNLISFTTLSNSNNILNFKPKNKKEESIELYKPISTKIRFYNKNTGVLINETFSEQATGKYEVALPSGEFFGIVDENKFDLFRQNNRVINRIIVP